MSLLFPFARTSQPQQFILPAGPFARGLVFAAIPGDRSIALSPAQPVVSGSSTVIVGRGGRGARAPATQIPGYVGYSSDISIAASKDYTLAAFCIPSSGSTTGNAPTQDFIGAQTNYLSIASNGFIAKVDNNTTALNAYTKMDPALFMATRRGSTISAYVPSGAVVTAATGTRAQTFTTICAGRYSGNNHENTETYLLLVWNRGIGLDEYLALAKNVCQIFPPQSRRMWVPSASSGTTITCTVGNASAAGVLANLNRGIACSVGSATAGGVSALLNRAIAATAGNAHAEGVSAKLNRAISATVGDAIAAGITASIAVGEDVTISCTPGDAQAAGVVAKLNRAIACTVGNASAAGVTASINVGGNVTISCTVGNAQAAGVTARFNRAVSGTAGNAQCAGVSARQNRAIRCSVGNAQAAGVTAAIMAPSLISCTAGNALAYGVIADIVFGGTIPFLPQTGIDAIVESYTKDLVYQAATKPRVFIARHHR